MFIQLLTNRSVSLAILSFYIILKQKRPIPKQISIGPEFPKLFLSYT